MRLVFKRTDGGSYLATVEGDHFGYQRDIEVARIIPPNVRSDGWIIDWHAGRPSMIAAKFLHTRTLAEARKRVTGIIMRTICDRIGTELNKTLEEE